MTHLPILVASAQVVSFIWEALVWKALTANERECRGCAFHDSVAFKKTFNRLKKELWRNSVTVRKLHTQRRAQVGLSLSLLLSFILYVYINITYFEAKNTWSSYEVHRDDVSPSRKETASAGAPLPRWPAVTLHPASRLHPPAPPLLRTALASSPPTSHCRQLSRVFQTIFNG